jgi:hypothetical protein
MGSDEREKGFCTDRNESGLLRLLPGVTETEVCNSDAADVVPTMKNCRAISVDSDGIIKIDYEDDSGGTTTTEVKTVKAGMFYQYRNVSKVYRYYTGTTKLTATVYQIAGDGSASLVVGVKLHR